MQRIFQFQLPTPTPSQSSWTPPWDCPPAPLLKLVEVIFAFSRLGPKRKSFLGHWSHLLVQRKSTGVGNVLLDSYDDSLETLIVFTLSEHLDSWILVDSLIWIVEDDMIHQEPLWILPGVRNVLLASLDDMQKTWQGRTFYRLVGNLISSIQPTSLVL